MANLTPHIVALLCTCGVACAATPSKADPAISGHSSFASLQALHDQEAEHIGTGRSFVIMPGAENYIPGTWQQRMGVFGGISPQTGDLDCKDISGSVEITGADIHGLDADNDGTGCEWN